MNILRTHCNEALVMAERPPCVKHVPVEQEVDRDGAQVPGGVSVQHPEERWEVKQLEQC